MGFSGFIDRLASVGRDVGNVIGSSISNGQFFYDGRKYTLDARIFYRSGGKQFMVPLASKFISDLEICSRVDKLYVDGHIIYEDGNGYISRVIGQSDAKCIVSFQEFELDSSGGVGSEKAKDVSSFVHTFIVDNIQILKNNQKSIVYTIYLTGIEYNGLMNQVIYSNYKDDEKKGIFVIAKEIIENFAKGEVDDTFQKEAQGVVAEYISAMDDTVQTSLNYLLQKQFFYPNGHDARAKVIVYDMLSGKYGLRQLAASPVKTVSNLLISTNNSQVEEFMSRNFVRLESVSDVRRSDMIRPFSNVTIKTFSLDSNEFDEKKYGSNEIANFFGGPGATNKLCGGTKNDSRTNVMRVASQWNNDINVYNDMLNAFLRWDSVVVTASGYIGRHLMEAVNLGFDQSVQENVNDTTASKVDRSLMHRQLVGSWYITKIRYVIKPNIGKFQQKLQLSRTFVNVA